MPCPPADQANRPKPMAGKQPTVYKPTPGIEHGMPWRSADMNRPRLPLLGIGIRKLLIGACLTLALSGCPTTDNTPPPQIISALTGQWRQVGGTGTLRFYPDTTVKLEFPDHKPPIRLLSNYEMLKGKIGIDAGGYWNGPIMMDLDLTHKRVVLSLPHEAPITLIKQPD